MNVLIVASTAPKTQRSSLNNFGGPHRTGELLHEKLLYDLCGRARKGLPDLEPIQEE